MLALLTMFFVSSAVQSSSAFSPLSPLPAAAAAAFHPSVVAVPRGGGSLPSSSRMLAAGRSTRTGTKLSVSSAGDVDQRATAARSASREEERDDGEDAAIFRDFAAFLISTQRDIIADLVRTDGSGEAFTEDRWGIFEGLEDGSASGSGSGGFPATGSGGITRVIQGGDVIEKGACSLTLIQGGKLTADRAASISGRNDGLDINAGDAYGAAALSIVLHTRSPLIPTFRSDVRIFLVRTEAGRTLAWFGGGADLTPYYLFDDDIAEFHGLQKELCDAHFPPGSELSDTFSYEALKAACDDYFYLPARGEHRGTGGIFFDDMPAGTDTLAFVRAVAESWMPSWLPIVERRRGADYTEEQRRWQLLRRGRYLEFNLLYDRGVKFGLANANPRVEGVMVSAPPLIAWEYNHEVEEGSEEERIMKVLKEPKDWVK